MRIRALLVTVSLLGCGSSTPPADTNPPGCTVTLSADGADVYTRVQTALIEARAGSTICFRDGCSSI